jgi:hypothetical protein
VSAVLSGLAPGPGPAVAAVLAHYGGGQWTVQKPPRSAGARVVVTDLALIPGTRSVLAAGTTGPPVPARKGHPAGVILEHQP